MEDEADVLAVSGLAEDIRDVLLEYWVSISREKLMRPLSLKSQRFYRWCNNRKFMTRIVR